MLPPPPPSRLPLQQSEGKGDRGEFHGLGRKERVNEKLQCHIVQDSNRMAMDAAASGPLVPIAHANCDHSCDQYWDSLVFHNLEFCSCE